MNYSILTSLSDIDKNIHSSVVKNYGDKLVAPFDGKTNQCYYIYVPEDDLKTKNEVIRRYNLIDTFQTSPEHEVDLYRDAVKNDNKITPGNYVMVNGYGHLPLRFDDVDPDGNYVCSTIIRGREYQVITDQSNVSNHPDPQLYTYKDRNDRPNLGNLVVDWDYVKKYIDQTHNDILSFLMRIKTLFRHTRVVIWDPTPEAMEVAHHMGLSTSSSLPMGEVAVTDRKYLISSYNKIAFFGDNVPMIHERLFAQEKVEEEVEDYLVFLYSDMESRESDINYRYFEYLVGIDMSINIDLDNLKRNLQALEPSDVYSMYKKYFDKFADFEHPSPLADVREHHYNKSSAMDFITSNSIIWFLENFDYYKSVLRG